jgi:hypothetical protein
MKGKEIMKLNALLLGSVFLFVGCATIPQNSNLNDMLLINTKSNASEKALVVFESKLPADHKVTMGSLDAVSNINTIYGKMIRQYMQSKFPNQGEGGLTVNVTLKSLATKTNMDTSIGNVLGATQTSLEAELSASVTVKKGNKELGTKEIIAQTEQSNQVSGQYGAIEKAHSDLINQVANKSIIVINSYLESLKL